jgi:sulfur carrier protein ThiS
VKVEVQLFATLAPFLPPGGRHGSASLDVPDDSRVRDVLARLGIPSDLERVVLVNGGDALPERHLCPGDIVTVFPPLAGGLSSQ